MRKRRPRAVNLPSRSKSASLRVLVTAGPTREYLDRIRFLSNPSTGQMGYAIAAALVAAGHEVILVSGPVALTPPVGARVVAVETTAEMAAAARRAFRECDAAIFAAAVCDYRPQRRAARKLPKAQGGMSLELVPTTDIAAACGRVKGGRVTIGFALEDHQARPHAERKLREKRFDAIVLNGPGTIGSSQAVVEFLQSGAAWERWPSASKAKVAGRLVRELERMAGPRWRGG